MELIMPLPFKEIIDELSNSDAPLLSARLAHLSNLDSEELKIFEKRWATIEPQRRRQIVYRLVELTEDNFELNFDSIFTSCLKDQDAEIRSKAIEGLWESEDASLITPLINLLEQDSSEKVQAAAAIAVGKFALLAEHKKLRPLHTSMVQEALLTAVNDNNKSVEVSRRVLESVAPLSLPQVKKAIMEAYESPDINLKVSSIYAMGKNCDCSWLPILIRELGSTSAEIRYEAAGACGELGEEEATPHLIELIADADTDVQLAAIQALGKIGDTEAKEHLEQCLNSPSEVIRQAAEQALQELEAWEDPLSFRFRV